MSLVVIPGNMIIVLPFEYFQILSGFSVIIFKTKFSYQGSSNKTSLMNIFNGGIHSAKSLTFSN